MQKLAGSCPLLRRLDETARHKVDKLGTPLVAVAEGGRRFGRDHEDCPHGVNVTVGRFALSHLQGGDAETPNILERK